MLLAVDAGNTQTVLGVFDLNKPHGSDLVAHWRVATDATRTSDEMGLLFSQMLSTAGPKSASVEGVAISSTVPSVQTELRKMVTDWFPGPSVVVGPGVRTGMSILYDDPREVGADRIANAVAAMAFVGAPALVVDFGTATTFDAISSKGEYLGGAILPGIEISLEALFQRASLLRSVELTEPRSVIGRSSAESIQSGVLYGFAEQTDGLCRRIVSELGAETKVISTGGLGSLITPFCSMVSSYEPWLTLYGLRLIFERNR